jgi:hypothetical protein
MQVLDTAAATLLLLLLPAALWNEDGYRRQVQAVWEVVWAAQAH